jgi:N-formylglutamate amidohydrolase
MMDSETVSGAEEADILTVAAPTAPLVPVVFASPHSGADYPADFVAASRLDPATLRRSEDSFVDSLFAAVPSLGAPLLSARFPRAYVDVNREAYELDPAMFSDPLPPHANIRSPRVAAGLGTIARVVASGAEIYRDKLTVAEAERRIARHYHPYHARLSALVAAARERFGWCLVVDCHSMPSVGGPCDRDVGASRVDVVLGDCFGGSCLPPIAQAASESFLRLGYRVVRNSPYAGGYTTRLYGKPQQGTQSLQIEINRALYMDEATHRPTADFDRLKADLGQVAAALVAAAVAATPAWERSARVATAKPGR